MDLTKTLRQLCLKFTLSVNEMQKDQFHLKENHSPLRSHSNIKICKDEKIKAYWV